MTSGGDQDRRPETWLTPGRLLALVAVLAGAYAAIVVIRALQATLLMLLVALFLSFAMEPAVQWLARHGWRRGAATGAVFFAVLVVGVGVVAAMTPLVVEQVSGLIASLPNSLEEVNGLLSSLPFGWDIEASPQLEAEIIRLSNEIGDGLSTIAFGAASNIVDIGAAALGLVVQLLAIGLVTFYLVADGPRFRRVLAGPLPPERQRELLEIWELAVAKTGGYIYSRLLMSVIAAFLHGLALIILDVPYPIPLGVWMGLMSAFVPVIGVYVGGILLLVVAAAAEPVDGLWMLAFIATYQQVENLLLAPRLQAQTMDVHPAVAFVSVLIGATLLGAVGALLALPAAAILQAVLSTYIHRHELIHELAGRQAESRLAGVPEEGGGTPPRRAERPADEEAHA
ncbi:MAG: AI-2E family transporter [Actinomycetota bacterium]|nr:AI-2E family transporter [Actinomycetota bacterium]